MRRIAVLGAAAAALAVAHAAPGAISIAITQSSVSTSAVTLDGVDHKPTVSVTVTVSGANQNGWRITAWAAQPASNGNQLPALEVTSKPTDDPCTGKGCTNPTTTGISWPVTLGTSSGAASKIYNAAANTGDGTIVLHVPVGVTVPANALPGTYTTSITLTITNAGP